MTDILTLIDGAIEDWETSDDAMRWTPEPPKGHAQPMVLGPADRVEINGRDIAGFLRAQQFDIQITPWQERILDSPPTAHIHMSLRASTAGIIRELDRAVAAIDELQKLLAVRNRLRMKYLHVSYSRKRGRGRR